jgi:hypothetical protein
MKVIYRITYPNGRIHIGKDRTETVAHFGSADSTLVEAELARVERRGFAVRKEILWKSEAAAGTDTSRNVIELVEKCCLRNRAVGYDRWPKPRARGTDPRTYGPRQEWALRRSGLWMTASRTRVTMAGW